MSAAKSETTRGFTTMIERIKADLEVAKKAADERIIKEGLTGREETALYREVHQEVVDYYQEHANDYAGFEAEQLALERKRRGISQKDVMFLTGRSRGWVSSIETGDNDSKSAAKLFASAIGVDDYAIIVARAEDAQASAKRTLRLLR